jgi:hypothetical protein
MFMSPREAVIDNIAGAMQSLPGKQAGMHAGMQADR